VGSGLAAKLEGFGPGTGGAFRRGFADALNIQTF
jgi:hypothetical protein